MHRFRPRHPTDATRSPSASSRPVLPALRCLLFAAALGPAATAQLGVQVQASTDLRVRASASTTNLVEQTLPAGSDLTGGFSLQVSTPVTPQNPLASTAQSAATFQQTGDTAVFELREQALGGFNLLGSQGSGSFGLHRIELVFSHPTARAMELLVERCVGAQQPGSGVFTEGSVTLPDGQVLVGTPQATTVCLFGSFSQTDRIPITIDQSGYRVVLETSGYGIGSLRGGAGRAAGNWRITLLPDPGRNCVAIGYGSHCGPVLDVTEDPTLGFVGFRATLDDPGLPTHAWLIGGGNRIQFPLTMQCDLLNDALVVLPWPIDAQGHAEVVLAPPTGQLFSLQLQAATWAQGLRLSNGFELACR